MHSRLTVIVAWASVVWSSLPASAWSTKEHILLTRLAAERLIADPATVPDMRDWLRRGLRHDRTLADEKEFLLHNRIGAQPRGADGLAFWAVMPDIEAVLSGSGDRERKVEPFGVPERLLHYVDIEFFYPDPAKRSYVDDLSHKPSLADFPRDIHDERWAKAGMLPFRVEQCYQQLVKELAAGRLNDKPGQYPRDEHAEKWAGMLAHYLEDNTQPQHATIDYRSSYYFKDKLSAPNVHGDVEYRLVDDDLDDYLPLRQEFWDLFVRALNDGSDTVKTNDPWQATVEVLLSSYDCLPMIGHAAALAYQKSPAGNHSSRAAFDAQAFFHFQGDYRGQRMTVMDMKARQLAWAVLRVQRLWRQAWDEAQNKSSPEIPASHIRP